MLSISAYKLRLCYKIYLPHPPPPPPIADKHLRIGGLSPPSQLLILSVLSSNNNKTNSKSRHPQIRRWVTYINISRKIKACCACIKYKFTYTLYNIYTISHPTKYAWERSPLVLKVNRILSPCSFERLIIEIIHQVT